MQRLHSVKESLRGSASLVPSVVSTMSTIALLDFICLTSQLVLVGICTGCSLDEPHYNISLEIVKFIFSQITARITKLFFTNSSFHSSLDSSIFYRHVFFFLLRRWYFKKHQFSSFYRQTAKILNFSYWMENPKLSLLILVSCKSL